MLEGGYLGVHRLVPSNVLHNGPLPGWHTLVMSFPAMHLPTLHLTAWLVLPSHPVKTQSVPLDRFSQHLSISSLPFIRLFFFLWDREALRRLLCSANRASGAGVQAQAQLLVCCVTLGNSLGLSDFISPPHL